MPRFRDVRTGVVVDVDDATADALGAGYAPVDAQKPAPNKAPAKKAPAAGTK